METVATGKEFSTINTEVVEIFNKGAIEPAENNKGFYSRLFTVPKKGGARRSVIN